MLGCVCKKKKKKNEAVPITKTHTRIRSVSLESIPFVLYTTKSSMRVPTRYPMPCSLCSHVERAFTGDGFNFVCCTISENKNEKALRATSVVPFGIGLSKMLNTFDGISSSYYDHPPPPGVCVVCVYGASPQQR